MKPGHVKPADAAIWSGGLGHGSTQDGGGGREQDAPEPPAQRRQDDLSLSERYRYDAAEGERTGAGQDPQLQSFLRLLVQSNEILRDRAEQSRQADAFPRAVPSALGLPVERAIAKLRASGFRLRTILREHDAEIPLGAVIAQFPGPGSIVKAPVGVQLTVSKGPPPADEREGRFSSLYQPKTKE